MKKVICFFVFFMLGISSYQAKVETYYSPYSSFTDYSPEIVLADDLTMVEKERRYRFFQYEKEYGGYYMAGEAPIMYPYSDSLFQFSKKMGPFSTRPVAMADRLIEEEHHYYRQELQKVRYLSFLAMDGTFSLSEIVMKVSDRSLSMSINCYNCSGEDSSITNGIIKEEPLTILEGGRVVIDLQAYYDVNDLSLVFYPFNSSATSYQMKIGNDATGQIGYLSETAQIDLGQTSYQEIYPLTTRLAEFGREAPAWEEGVSDSFCSASNVVNCYDQVDYYYQDKLYAYYRLKKQYQEDYAVDMPGFIRDDTIYQDFYRYQRRDRFRLIFPSTIDEIIDFSSFIVEDTTSKATVSTNLQYPKNGSYEVIYHLPYEDIKKVVTLQLPEKPKDYSKDFSFLQQQLSDLSHLSLENHPPFLVVPGEDPCLPLLKEIRDNQEKLRKRSLGTPYSVEPHEKSSTLKVLEEPRSFPHILSWFLVLLSFLLFLFSSFFFLRRKNL